MKHVLMLSLVLAAATQAHAITKPVDLPACQTIVQQCEAAGFKPGDHKKGGKGVWADCVHQVAKGKTVTGVTVSQADAKTCQDAAKADRKEIKAEKAAKKM